MKEITFLLFDAVFNSLFRIINNKCSRKYQCKQEATVKEKHATKVWQQKQQQQQQPQQNDSLYSVWLFTFLFLLFELAFTCNPLQSIPPVTYLYAYVGLKFMYS